MAVQHKNLSGSQLHEQKGVSAAASGDFNFASSGANSWDQTVETSNNTPSAVSTVEFTGLSAYRELTLSFRELLHGTPSRIWLQVSSDNGSTWISTNYHATYNQDGTSASDSAHNALFINQTAANYTNGTIIISNFNIALPSLFQGVITGSSTAGKTGTSASLSLLGSHNSATALDAIRINTSTGTFTSGEITVEGIRS